MLERRQGVSVDTTSKRAISQEPARVVVRHNGKVVTTVVARIEKEMGADGGLYDVVKLEREEPKINPQADFSKAPVLP